MATKKERAIEIRTATLPGENTPERVGSLLEDIVDHQDRVDTSLETFTDELAETYRTIEENKAQAAAKISYTASVRTITLENSEKKVLSFANLPVVTTSVPGLMAAADKAKLDGIPGSIFDVLIPTDLKVSCLERITISNKEPVYIKAELSPATVLKNIIFISDNRAALVDADGKITPVEEGKSRISIIPTCNTSLAKTILIEVGRPLARLVNSKSSLRLLSGGLFRFT